MVSNETSFPSTHPDPSGNAGTVVSISDAGGVVINSSGVATISNGAGSGNTVTITGFPSDLHSRTLGSGVGLQVQTTSTLHTYTYHKSLIKESDLVNFSADLDSFRSRYRVVDTTPTSNNDEGDLIFRKSDNKLLVFNGTAYQEASSVGKSLTLNKIPLTSGDTDKTPQSIIFMLVSLGLIKILYIPVEPKISAGRFKFLIPLITEFIPPFTSVIKEALSNSVIVPDIVCLDGV